MELVVLAHYWLPSSMWGDLFSMMNSTFLHVTW